jgi:hypothetical protein
MTPESAIDFKQLDQKEVLQDGAIEEYDKGMSFFFSELVDLNTIIYLAERIVEFPFDLFVSRDDQIFWSVVMASFHNSAVLTITRLATDQKNNVFTLPHFKNRVLELVKEDFKAPFQRQLRKTRFDNKVSALLTKTKNLRHHRIGHTTRDFVTGNIKVFRPNLSELKELRDALNSLLDALAFNVEYSMLPIPYDSRVLPKRKTDIEMILDSIAKESKYLNMSERFPERWRYRRRSLAPEKLTALNEYRRKFGMPEV